MPGIEWIHQGEDSRVLIVSQRSRLPIAPRCMNYEYESVIADIDRADVISFDSSMDPGRMRRRLVRRFGSLGMIGHDRSPHVNRRYDVLFCSIQSVRDLKHFGPIDRWLRCADLSICQIDEVWASRVNSNSYELRALAQFDHVVSGCRSSVEPLADAIGKPVQYLPPGIDSLVFCPYPDPPTRTIDVYSMGRRSPETHRAIRDFAESENRFYLYDTLSQYGVKDVVEHRHMLTELIKRTRFFIANRAKVNSGDQTDDQEELGFRFFEGAAGGAVMIGEAPDTPCFKEFFGWEDAVIDLPFGSTHIGELLSELESNPQRLERASRRNVENSLLRHDWAYRWSAVLEAAGAQAPPHTEHRCNTLVSLANLVAHTSRAAA